MKDLKTLLKGSIPLIEPTRYVKFVVSARSGGPLSLPQPTPASELSCPDCGSTKGFYNLPWDAWSCAEDVCISKWRVQKGPEREPAYKNTIQGIPVGLESANMTSCDQPHQFKEEWIKWAINPISCLVFSGLAGTGKSYASVAILKLFSDCTKKVSRFVNISDLYLQWKLKVKEGHDMDLLLRLIDTELLVIDDVGQKTPTDSFTEFLYLLISKRNDTGKATIVTTNLTYNDMRVLLGDALTSRFTVGKAYKFTGPDRRKQPEW